jgi:phenylacetate-coenzyme A ligase PaaK-like adenylate-forming protein
MVTLSDTPAIDRFMALDRLYEVSDQHDLAFVAALREALAWHLEHSPPYRELCRRAGFGLDDLRSIEDVPRVPHIFVNSFKQYELLSIDREAIALNLTSSGTTGQKSQIFFDEASLKRGLAMVDRAHEEMGLTRYELPTNYVIFAYDPNEAKNVGTAFTDDNITKFARKRRSYHALRWDESTGAFAFRAGETLTTVQAYAEEGLPVRFLGFPAFLHRLIQLMRERRIPPFRFGADSFVLTGGGWKTAEDERIEPEAFIREVEEQLGIPAGNVRDGYGMVEHGVPYLQCEHHRFHVPAYSRAYIRDVGTLEVLERSQSGFLQLVTPYNLAQPGLSLLTSDLAALHDDCPCGRATPTIEILGRAGTRKNKGCAISASQLLKNASL